MDFCRVFNNGKLERDFTYIDDIVSGVLAANRRTPLPDASGVRHAIYNLGNNRSEPLLRYIELIEQALGRKAEMKFEPLQKGDVVATYADIEASRRDLGFAPSTPIETGIPRFIEWYKAYHAELEAVPAT